MHETKNAKKEKKARAAAHAPQGALPQKKENEVYVKHFASQKLRFR